MHLTRFARADEAESMYGLAELRKAMANPHLALREVNRAYHRRFYTRSYNTDGIDVLEADWDNLIILDACRADVFEERTSLDGSFDGSFERRTSRGAATPEFVRANFAGKRLHDTVYFSENAWYLQLRDEIDAEVHATVYADDRDIEVVTRKAQEVAKEYPHKRLVVHLLPPHHPFQGPTAEASLPSFDEQSNDLYERIQRGELDVDDETLRRAYVENLDRVLPAVEQLLEAFVGKTVVTADHGELLGDRTSPLPVKDYGHHTGLYVEELVKVPWFVHDGDERKEIVAEEPLDRKEHDPERLDQHLRDLGYLD